MTAPVRIIYSKAEVSEETSSQLALAKVSRLLAGLASGTYRGIDFSVGQTAATGAIRLHCVGDGAEGSVVEVTVGTAKPVVVPVAGLDDGAAAQAVAAALNNDPDASQFASASASGDTVGLTAKALGPDGNSIGFFALTDAGTVIRSGPFLTGGASLISML